MSQRRPRIYIDANIIIELAKMAKKTHRADRVNDLWFVQQMLRAADAQEIELMSSSMTVAECLSIDPDSDCDKETQEFFVNILTSGRLIKLVQPSIFIAEAARDLRWKHGIKLKPFDSIHVASALDAACQEMLSWDGGIAKLKSAEHAKKLESLGLRCIAPRETTILPDEYRQGVLTLNAPATPAKSTTSKQLTEGAAIN